MKRYAPQFINSYTIGMVETADGPWVMYEDIAEDTKRLDWLDANPRVIVRSGKQHVRPLIDLARLSDKGQPI